MKKFLLVAGLAMLASPTVAKEPPRLSLLENCLKINLLVEAAKRDSGALLGVVVEAGGPKIRRIHKEMFGWPE